MKEQTQPTKPKFYEQAGKVLSTVILIACTLLCFVVVLQNVLKQDANILGYRLFYVVTGSMEPTLPEGSLLVVKKQGNYQTGDIITYYAKDLQIQGQPNTHRIISAGVEEGRTYFTTKGDANPVADPYPVYPEDVIGRVCFSFGTVEIVGILLGILSTPQGFFVIILLPLLVVAVLCMKDFKKTLNEELRRAAMAGLEADQTAEEEGNRDEAENEQEKTV